MSLDWNDYHNRHYGEHAVILGKGPSAAQWVASPRPAHPVIAINDAGKIAKANYNISRHNWIHYGTPGPWFMPIVDGWEINNLPYKRAEFRIPVMENAIWFIPIPCPGKVMDMNLVAKMRLMPTPGGSAINAIVLAKYMGFDSITFVGVDGGNDLAKPAYSELIARRPDTTAPDYDALKRHTAWYAHLYYPGKHTFWTP